MNFNIKLTPEMLADHFILSIILGLSEKENENFLLNKSESWKLLIDQLEKKQLKVKLLQRFFKIKSMRRQKFKKIQQIYFKDNKGRLTLDIINNDIINVSENDSINNIVDKTIEETLKLTTKNISLTKTELEKIKEEVKTNLNNGRII